MNPPAVTARHQKLVFLLWGGGVGGVERHTLALCQAITQRQLAEASIVFIQRLSEERRQRLGQGVRMVDLGFDRGRDVMVRPSRLGRSLRDLDPNVVFNSAGWIGTVASRVGGYGGPLIVREHGNLMNPDMYHRWQRRLTPVAERFALTAADACLAVSPAMAAEIGRVLGSRVPILVVPNGVDTNLFQPAAAHATQGDVVFGVASRLVRGKGIEEVLQAFRGRMGGQRALLRIAGDGPDAGRLRRLAAESRCLERIHFLGVVDDMAEFWRSCDVAVHATTWVRESFCLAVAEAQACGIPAIVSDAGALPWLVVDGLTGTVVPAGSCGALEQAMDAYAADSTLRGRHGQAARRRIVDYFGIDRAAARYVSAAWHYGAWIDEGRRPVGVVDAELAPR